MAKRFIDTTIWKKQRWFKKLSPLYKLVWKYMTDTCDHAGIFKVDYAELIDDLGIDEFDIIDFINKCNIDFNKETGKNILRERIILIDAQTIWITGFIKFQYENKSFEVNPTVAVVKSALYILKGYGVYEQGLSKGYFTLSQPFVNGSVTVVKGGVKT